MRPIPTRIGPLVHPPVRVDLVAIRNFTFYDLEAAQCDNRTNLLLNNKQEDPCTVALDLLKPCSIGQNNSQPFACTACTCNLVFYNLLSACTAFCLQKGAISYSDWTNGCQVPVTKDYLPDRESSNIPQWAQTPPNGGSFDQEAVLSLSQHRGWTLMQKLAPVITVLCAALIAFLLWFIRRRNRRRGRGVQGGYRMSRLNAHRPSESESSANSTRPLAHSIPHERTSARPWSVVGNLFSSAKKVRPARRNTTWAIDDDQQEGYAHNIGTRPYDPYIVTPRFERGHNRFGSSLDDSSKISDSMSFPDYIQDQPKTSWWNSVRLKKLFTPNGTEVMDEDAQPSSHGVGFFDHRGLYAQHKSGIRVDRLPDQIGLSAGRSLLQNETDSSQGRDLADSDVLLISRTPGVDFLTTEGCEVGRQTAHTDEPETDRPDDVNIPGSRGPGVDVLSTYVDLPHHETQIGSPWNFQRAYQVRSPSNASIQTSNIVAYSSWSNALARTDTQLAPSHQHPTNITETERFASYPNLSLKPSTNSIRPLPNVSAEQLINSGSRRGDVPAMLSPPAVRDTGYNLPYIHNVPETGHARNNGSNATSVRNVPGYGRINGYDGNNAVPAGPSNDFAMPSRSEPLDARNFSLYPSSSSESDPVPPYHATRSNTDIIMTLPPTS